VQSSMVWAPQMSKTSCFVRLRSPRAHACPQLNPLPCRVSPMCIRLVVAEFTCENPKCRAEMSISGTMMRDAALEDMRKKQKKKGFLSKFLGTDKISVGVECAKCQRVHNLAIPDGVLG